MIDIGNRFIYAEQTEISCGKPVYAIVNKSSGAVIAQVGWYPKWRQYVMFPLPGTVFNDGCLESIIKFMRGLK